MNGYSSHLPRLNYGCKIECLQWGGEDRREFNYKIGETYKSCSETFVSFLELAIMVTITIIRVLLKYVLKDIH